METQSTQDLSDYQDTQKYSVIDEQGNLIGQVERILKSSSDQIKIIFSLDGYSKPLFKVHHKSIIKVDLENNQFIIKLTEKMRDRLNQYLSFYINGNQVEQNGIESVDESEEQEEKSNTVQDESLNESVDSETVRLLAERLNVTRDRQKIGEVIVRKQVETEIVEVPVRREKLIVEQVGATEKPLAKIDLSQGKVEGIELNKIKNQPHQVTVRGELSSLKAAYNLLQTIAMDEDHGCAKVRIELVLDNPQHQQQYQELFDRCVNS